MHSLRRTASCQPAEPRPGAAGAQAGFTLLELMVTVAVAAVLLTIAVPSFKKVISNTHLRGAHNDLVATLRYARTEAVTRNNTVAVAQSSGPNGWADGWRVIAPAGSSTVLRRHAGLQSHYKVETDPASASSVKFDEQGAREDGPRCFRIKDEDTNAHTDPKYIKLGPSGAVHSSDNC